MLTKLSKNQYVKMVKTNNEQKDIEYGVVLNTIDDSYEIMSIGFENRHGNFLEYPIETQNLVQTYCINDANFDEVKENEVRRKMNVWMDRKYRN